MGTFLEIKFVSLINVLLNRHRLQELEELEEQSLKTDRNSCKFHPTK